MKPGSDPHPLAAELFAEKAASYFRIVRKLDGALQALKEWDLERAAQPKPTPAQHRRREALLIDAAEWAWFFTIQRETLGLSLDDEVYRQFGISEEVRRRMGPRESQISNLKSEI